MKKARLGVGVAVILVALLSSVVVAEDATSPRFPGVKPAIADKIEALRAASKVVPRPKTGHGPTRVDAPEPAAKVGGVPAGIGRLFGDTETVRPPGYPDDTFTNAWSVFSGTTNIDVWAGSRGGDPSQGFLVVVEWNADRTIIVGGGEFESTSRGGKLRILSALNSTLTIVDEQGSSMAFDALSRSFR